MTSQGLAARRAQKPTKVVDKSIGESKARDKTREAGIFDTVREAVDSCNEPSIIKITSYNYVEQLLITSKQAGIELLPREQGGQVALLQKTQPCLVVDVGPGQECTISNMEMHLTGQPDEPRPDDNADAGEKLEEKGHQAAMQEFFSDNPDGMSCIILLKTGTLILNSCTFSLNGIQTNNNKLPCIIVYGGHKDQTKLVMKNCSLKGDELQPESLTAGIVAFEADIDIQGTRFDNFKSGAIMLQAKQWNEVKLDSNKIVSCESNGIYVQGKQARPDITNNNFSYCKCAAITTTMMVNAYIAGNTIDRNAIGIEINNNMSQVIQNDIKNS